MVMMEMDVMLLARKSIRASRPAMFANDEANKASMRELFVKDE